MTAYLIVKSDTSLVNKEEFDDWYQVEHLNEANKVLMSLNAKRAWINGTKSHLAIYKFKNIRDAEKAISSKGLKKLIKKLICIKLQTLTNLMLKLLFLEHSIYAFSRKNP